MELERNDSDSSFECYADGAGERPYDACISQREKDDASNKAKLCLSVRPSETAEDCNVPLSQLIRQLLRNLSQQSLRKLQQANESTDPEEEDSSYFGETNPGLSFLLQFQRLLIGQLYSEDEREIQVAASLLSKYSAWLCSHAIENLQAFFQSVEQLPQTEYENSNASTLLFNSSIIGNYATSFYSLRVLNFCFFLVLLAETIVGLITIERRRCDQVVRLPLSELTNVLALFDKAIKIIPQETSQENHWPSSEGK